MSDEEWSSCSRCAEYQGTVPLKQTWISCDICSKWYHTHCLSLTRHDISRIKEYHCPECAAEHGGTVWMRSSGRKRNKVDYKALDEGDVDDAIIQTEHPHIAAFKEWAGDGTIDELAGDELTLEYALRTRIPKPVKIPSARTQGLGFTIPKFDVDDLVSSMGEDHYMEVMDVLTQNGSRDKWQLGKWRDYFKSSEEARERIFNVLSLEISNCSVGEAIKRPTYVEQVDLVDKLWPDELSGKPIVQKYCLMGVKDSYTDFHLDFAGTSVYYTVIYGEKSFMFFPPTEHNLKRYVQWITTPSLTSQFLGNLGLEQGVKVTLLPGDVMIIPSGWIHAVYTPVDTLVVGGNFLTSFNISEQLKIIDIEIRTKVDKKFKFPNFNKLMFLTAWAVLEGKLLLDVDIDKQGSLELVGFLKSCLARKNEHHQAVPVKVVGNGKVLVRKFEQFVNDHYEVKMEHVDQQIKKESPTGKRSLEVKQSVTVKKAKH